jgi:hypothetical protein
VASPPGQLGGSKNEALFALSKSDPEQREYIPKNKKLLRFADAVMITSGR